MRNPMWIPKAIIAVIVLVFVGWGGFWVVASMGAERAFAGWFQDRRDEGWTAEYASLDTAGFPNRLDTTVTELNLFDPETGVGWSAPVLQLLALVYQPTQVIAVLPGEQTYVTPRATHDLTSDDFRASAAVRPELSLPLSRANVVMEGGRIASSLGWETRADLAKLFLRETPEGVANQYDIVLTVEGFEPDAAFLQRARRSGVVENVMEGLEIRSTITFDAPWDRAAIEVRRPQPREIDLTALAASWGELELSMEGRLTVDAQGVPTGKVQVNARNWRDIIALAEASGALPRSMAQVVEQAAGLIARASGDPETLDVALGFANGMVSLGPIPLGPAPVIALP
ncbi:DUF2125 domain-containing protein [Maritimibacter sp. DP1N21-5]|uniref:DUF2125 domain-containing protein n=1 Tax=Maritimibacter sp. DP1N21-5 TaxID=2836867 RepID=UPI001C49191F|nr:DUF2125 domain-containing protein [Maritimibacter sp. DP1N21-5]MBV7410417.1 DUF2125 domain-containing protein [Maritimibacter sp. DP1N21-5]